jgi:hypothetical protein
VKSFLLSINSIIKTIRITLCYTKGTPDDGREKRPKHVVLYSNKYKINRKEKVRLTDNLYVFELIKRQRTGMNRLKIVLCSN